MRTDRMRTHDSTVKRADKVQPGDVIVGVDARGEHLHRVGGIVDSPHGGRIRHGRVHGRVTLVMGDRTASLDADVMVRVAHPDVVAHAVRTGELR